MGDHHIYENMFEDFRHLEENKLVNDTCIDIFTNALQNQYDKEEVKVLSCHFFKLAETHGFQNGQGVINSHDLNCPTIIFPCHIVGEIGHWVTVMRIFENQKITFYYVDSVENYTYSFNRVKEVLFDTPLFPSNQDVSWIILKNPPQIEVECGSRVGLHMHLCCEGSTLESILYNLNQLPEGRSLQRQVRGWFKTCVTTATVNNFSAPENENSLTWMAVSGIHYLTHESPKLSEEDIKRRRARKRKQKERQKQTNIKKIKYERSKEEIKTRARERKQKSRELNPDTQEGRQTRLKIMRDQYYLRLKIEKQEVRQMRLKKKRN